MRSPATLAADAAMAARYATGLRRFLRTPLPAGAPDPHELTEERRGKRFLELAGRCIFENPASPYRRLLAHAGIDRDELGALVGKEGLEGALVRLFDAGVYLRMDEFKGRVPVVRGSLEFTLDDRSVDNPWADPVYAAGTGGTTGTSKRVLFGFPQVDQDAAYHRLLRSSFGITGRPYVMWRPVPPGFAGLSNCLQASKLGARVVRWFSQNPTGFALRTAKEFAFTRYTVEATRRWGSPLPAPEYAPVSDALHVAGCLAGLVAGGTPPLFNAPVSSAVRVCQAARETGLELTGVAFRLGGEPLTPSRARLIHEAGGTILHHYAMAELGTLGQPCGAPSGVDDVHVAADKVAIVERPETLAGDPVSALLVTTLRLSAPKVMVNVDTGDCATVDHSPCGCPIGSYGFTTRLRNVRSYEKLTSEGMNFLHGDVIQLVDEVLPGRFGGNPTDYQLVETSDRGLTRVSVVVSPRLGHLVEAEVREAVLARLGEGPSYRGMMSGIWQDAGTVEVLRREPYTNSVGKVLPLHFIR